MEWQFVRGEMRYGSFCAVIEQDAFFRLPVCRNDFRAHRYLIGAVRLGKVRFLIKIDGYFAAGWQGIGEFLENDRAVAYLIGQTESGDILRAFV